MFDGRDVTRLPMYQRARAGMGYLAQDSSVFKQLSVEDNLMAILETRPGMNRKQRKERQNELLDQFGLTHIRKTKANRVSGGERRRLEIARSLITEPKLIMLDEPFAGIDPKTVGEIQDQIRNLADELNLGILLTDHQFRETLEVTDRSYLIREGRVFAYGRPRARSSTTPTSAAITSASGSTPATCSKRSTSAACTGPPRRPRRTTRGRGRTRRLRRGNRPRGDGGHHGPLIVMHRSRRGADT